MYILEDEYRVIAVINQREKDLAVLSAIKAINEYIIENILGDRLTTCLKSILFSFTWEKDILHIKVSIDSEDEDIEEYNEPFYLKKNNHEYVIIEHD